MSWNEVRVPRLSILATGVNRTRRARRTQGFFRFLPVANEMAGERLTHPRRYQPMIRSSDAEP